jgi:DnaJ family protein C protein 28
VRASFLHEFVSVDRNAIDRLVEDLTAESMAKGEFDNLPCDNYNPLVDTTTHNLNKLLIQNGYAPEWVTLTREIK